jgi:hypothetical protein
VGVDHRFAVLAHYSGVISAQAFDEYLPTGCVQHDRDMGVQPGGHRPDAKHRPGPCLDQVTNGLAEVIPVGVLHGHP